MILPQDAQKLTAIDIQDSSAQKCSDSQEGVQGSGSEAITQLTAEHQAEILAPHNNLIGNHTPQVTQPYPNPLRLVKNSLKLLKLAKPLIKIL
jgi:hypothetical protein